MSTHRIEMPWRYWTIIDGTLDNEIDIITVEGDDEGAQDGSAIRAAGWSQVSTAFDGLDSEAQSALALSDEPVAIELNDAQWRYAIDLLRRWQEVQAAGGGAPADPVEPDIIAVIEDGLGSA